MIRLRPSIRRRLSDQRGFTLIEMLVVMLLLGVVVAAMLTFYLGIARSFADTSNRIVNQDDARTAMNQLTRYIRMACSSDSNLTSFSDAVAVASPQELVFYADLDGDGQADKVRFYLSGQTMRMATVAPDLSTSPPTYPAYTLDGVVVMDGITNGTTPIFTYYQMNPAYLTNPIASNDTLVVLSNPTTDSDRRKILAVGLTLYVNEAPELSKGSVKLESLAQIRQRYNGGLSGS
jgi:prepilin-type N-terminal cleavage/methylation domain-containing protein